MGHKEDRAEKQVFSRLKKYGYNNEIKNGYAKFGKYNDLPEKLLALTNESTWHDICIRGKAQYFQGDGLAYENGAPIPLTANDRGETWNDILEQIAMSYSVFEGFGLVVIYDLGSVAGTNEPRIAEVIHYGLDKLRAEQCDSTGFINNWFYSDDWSKVKDVEKQAEKIPVFNPSNVAAVENEDGVVKGQQKQILVFRTHNSENKYYPKPRYYSALQAILTHSEIAKFRLAHLSNAIAASLHFKYIGDPGDDEMLDVVKDFNQQLSGAQNAGRFITTQAAAPGEGWEITPVSAGGAANIYSDYNTVVRDEILGAHGIIFKEAVGLEEENSGLSAEQIEEKFVVFFNTTIRKGQQKLLSAINRLAPYIGTGADFVINKVDLLNGLEREEDTTITDEETDQTLE